jgi:CspA family cold shock protein
MPKGTIKWFDSEKGYGFIQQNEGDSVDYEIGEGRKGPCATNVKKS